MNNVDDILVRLVEFPIKVYVNDGDYEFLRELGFRRMEKDELICVKC